MGKVTAGKRKTRGTGTGRKVKGTTAMTAAEGSSSAVPAVMRM